MLIIICVDVWTGPENGWGFAVERRKKSEMGFGDRGKYWLDVSSMLICALRDDTLTSAFDLVMSYSLRDRSGRSHSLSTSITTTRYDLVDRV